ncbi:M14 family metallopeptidase [Alicycliphilus denitrificans]|uniref:Peptidase M14 carboxypeptidase A n=1 Tax=Alicycliphilus denitrificans (strain DSM 14773 / CIP 107495 / K601) TaxID=596154 RepID=F4GBH2_ALIDK|nr:M14 family metallopeptidase [Alicycliphilus denitrificans]AEB85817.1 peptidase M14 carboxypeptidase A [Alicycliphilus denitrificans K601]
MMTPKAPHHSTAWQPAAALQSTSARALRQGWALVAAAVLSACSSTPLPPWTTQPPSAAQPPAAAQARRPVPPPLGTAPRGEAPAAPVTITPIGPNAPEPSAAAPLPYGEAVAARFPDPSVRYETPGLAEGRRAFTTNAELTQWLRDLAAAQHGATRMQMLDLGLSQRGTPIHALVLTRAAGTDAMALEASRRPTVLLIGQQHGDEPAGSEALLVVARELAQGLLEPMLDRINVIVVPRANPDGADAGTRVTASGADMNRDHLLLQTPEAQALARLVRNYRPMAIIDAHEYTVAGRFLEKFHAIQRYDVLLQHATTANLPEFMTKAALEWYRAPMVKALGAESLTQEWYYTTSTRPDDLRISMGGTQPDTGRNVNGLKNAVSMLLETRGVGIGRTHIQRRVHSHVTAITSALRSTVERANDLEQVRSYEARDISAQACRGDIVVEAGPTPTQRELVMLDPDTGADRTLRVDWNSSLELVTLKKRPRPCGYWLAGGASEAVERLKLLGLQVMRVAEPGSILADTYQETGRTTAQRQDVRGTVAGGQGIVRVQVTPTRSAIDVPAESYYVPLNQPLANLAVAALEPDTQNSYFANRLIPNLGDTARVMAPPSLVFEDTD